jgi:hypothetical protein
MNVAGHPIPLSNAAQAQRGGGAGIGGVALNDQEATREAILTQMIGDARADDAPSDQHDICSLRYGFQAPLSCALRVLPLTAIDPVAS